jgi:hypothetical protein
MMEVLGCYDKQHMCSSIMPRAEIGSNETISDDDRSEKKNGQVPQGARQAPEWLGQRTGTLSTNTNDCTNRHPPISVCILLSTV